MVTANIFLTIFFTNLLILGIIFIYAFYLYYKKLSEFKAIEAQAYKKAENIIEHAHKRSEAILEHVEKKAEEILTHAELFKLDIERQVRETLRKSGDVFAKDLDSQSKQFAQSQEKLFLQLRDQYIAEAKKAFVRISEEADSEINNFGRLLLDEKKHSEEGIKKEVEIEMLKVKKEIEAYKAEKLAKVKESIHTVVEKLAEELLGQSLTIKDQEQFLIKSLEQAKKEGVFSI